MRPALRYYGGKWKLAPWVIAHFPPHRIYLEAYSGGASVLLQKPRVYGEILNDLDDQVTNVFRVLRDPALAAALKEAVGLTPFARSEFEAAYSWSDDPVEQARRAIVRSFMGFGSNGFHGKRGMRTMASAFDRTPNAPARRRRRIGRPGPSRSRRSRNGSGEW